MSAVAVLDGTHAGDRSLVTPRGHTEHDHGYELDHNVDYDILGPGTSRPSSGDSSITGSAAASAAGFQIVIRFPDATLTPAQQAVFTAAADRWEQVITGDLPDINTSIGLVDDLVIDATGPSIDGPGNVLGSAGPTSVRSGSLLPARGQMRFDSADLAGMQADGTFDEVIVHEMGHVLGLGTLWSNKGLISGSGTSEPRFTGSNAVAQYQALFGTSATTVPVENTGGAGTAEGHWRENGGTGSSFYNELMTGYLNGGIANPLSRVSLAQFADLGYPGVNLNAFDLYTPPGGGNAYPAVASLNSPAASAPGMSFTLTANGVGDPNGSVSAVRFYRESNGLPGLQVFANGAGDVAADVLVATDTSASSGFTASLSTTGLANGSYTYYAQAADNLNLVSTSVSTTHTVQTASPQPAWLSSSNGATWNASTKVLTVTGAATITSDPGADAPVVTASGSAAVLTINPAAGSQVNLGGLQLSNNASANVAAGGAARVLVVANGANFTLDATASLDLADNALVLRNASPSTAAAAHTAVDGLVGNAFNNFGWNQAGITSSTAAADVANGGPSTLGVLLNNDGGGDPLFYGAGTGSPTFMGASVDANTVMVRFTRLGDGDLSGMVDSVDFALFQAGYTGTPPYVGFAFGDYDYNGVIDSVDFGLFQAGYTA